MHKYHSSELEIDTSTSNEDSSVASANSCSDHDEGVAELGDEGDTTPAVVETGNDSTEVILLFPLPPPLVATHYFISSELRRGT